MLLLLHILTHSSEGRCPFQNPFWFYDKPIANNVYDENGEMVANKIRVGWGRMENFKCVDYFQVEYFHRSEPSQPLEITNRIGRNQRSVDIEVVSCTEYYFKVVAAEDWNGIREDFKVYSEAIRFTLKYTPKFKTLPRFRERRRMTFKPPQPPNQLISVDLTQDSISENLEYSEELVFNVRWRLKDVDYPICLNHFELHYVDKEFNMTKFLRSVMQPFKRPKFLIQIKSFEVPNCESDFEFMFKMFGIHRKFTTTYWTPPSCLITTTPLPPPTTTDNSTEFNNTEIIFLDDFNSSYVNSSFYDDEITYTDDDVLTTILNETEGTEVPESVSPSFNQEADNVISTTKSYAEEMKATRAQIESLKQDYEKIGLQDFTALKDSFFQSMKDFLNQMKTEDVEDGDLLFNDGKLIFINT